MARTGKETTMRRKTLAALTLGAALALTACGTDEPETVAETTSEATTTSSLPTTGIDRPLAIKESEAIDACYDGLIEMVNNSGNKPDTFEWVERPEVQIPGNGLGNSYVLGAGYIYNSHDIPFEHDVRCQVKVTKDGARLMIADAELAW